ncbi:MAG: ribosome recycling factor [Proteobacteria bacterium]|nr:ribosome recycling factor [Pseudomonadota bacterium]
MNKFELKKELNDVVEFFTGELSKIRTGRASGSLIEDITLEVYGSKMRIKELGSITTPEPQTILITPWDKSQIPSISKAINTSELNLNSSYDNEKIRLPIPALSEERRLELTKLVTSKLEASKTTLRNIRNEVNKSIDKDFTDKKIGEDEKFTLKDEADKIIKEYTEKLEGLAEDKKKSVMEI